MRIDSPDPRPRESGDYATRFNIGYGKPNGDILLDEDGTLKLEHLDADDCDRLIKAATEIKSQVLTSQARMAAPHGRGHLHKGTCQLCGRPESYELHAGDDGRDFLVTLACGHTVTRPFPVVRFIHCGACGRHEHISAMEAMPAPSGMQDPAPVARVTGADVLLAAAELDAEMREPETEAAR